MNSHSSFPIIHPRRVYSHLFHQVQRDAVYDAFYKLTNSYTQISSYIFDVVRASVPKMNLDVFEAKEEIAHTIKEELTKSMTGYGFLILHALVTDIEPAHKDKEVSLPLSRPLLGRDHFSSAMAMPTMLLPTLLSTYTKAMNEINAAKRLRAAAAETAEARKVWTIENMPSDS